MSTQAQRYASYAQKAALKGDRRLMQAYLPGVSDPQTRARIEALLNPQVEARFRAQNQAKNVKKAQQSALAGNKKLMQAYLDDVENQQQKARVRNLLRSQDTFQRQEGIKALASAKKSAMKGDRQTMQAYLETVKNEQSKSRVRELLTPDLQARFKMQSNAKNVKMAEKEALAGKEDMMQAYLMNIEDQQTKQQIRRKLRRGLQQKTSQRIPALPQAPPQRQRSIPERFFVSLLQLVDQLSAPNVFSEMYRSHPDLLKIILDNILNLDFEDYMQEFNTPAKLQALRTFNLKDILYDLYRLDNMDRQFTIKNAEIPQNVVDAIETFFNNVVASRSRL